MVKTTELNRGIELNELSFSYGANKVLDNISLNVDKGKILSIIGKSGSGKSTLLKCISTLLVCQSGDAYLHGQKYIDSGEVLYEDWEIRQKIIIVFQDFNLFPSYTVLRNITLALEKVKKIEKNQAVFAANLICDKLNIAHLKEKYPNQISGGEAQRVALARALVLKPQILLLDEVTSAIDPTTIQNVIKVIDEIRNAEDTKNTSIIMVTHNLRFAIDYSDNIAFMHQGKLIEEYSSSKFLEQAKNDITIQYIVDSKYSI